MTFPLLLLPYMAICVVIDHFNLNELIHFSLCSKKSHRIASRKPKQKVEILIRAQKNPEILVRLNKIETYKFEIWTPFDFTKTRMCQKVSIAGKPVTSKTMRGNSETLWRYGLCGIKEISTHLTDLLKSPITRIHLLSESKPNTLIDVIDWLISEQKSIERCRIGSSHECVKHLLEKKFDVGTLCILKGERLNGDCLLNMTSPFVSIKNSHFTAETVNGFLKDWQNGGHQETVFLRIEVVYLREEHLTSGIEVEERPLALTREYRHFNDKTIERRGGFDIRRNDGMVGTVFVHFKILEFGVDPREVIKEEDEEWD
ncbi:unnamed protein product [Caenorhabditis brenneri]